MLQRSGHTYPVPMKTSRLTLVVPDIRREFTEDGTRYYEVEGGKKWDADTYDRLLVPVRLQVKKRFEVQGAGETGIDRRKKSAWCKPEAQIRPIKKKCRTCKTEKEISHFSNATNALDGKRLDCIECVRNKNVNKN